MTAPRTEVFAGRLAPIARQVATSAKLIAALLCFAWGLILIVGSAQLMSTAPGDAGSDLIALVVWQAVLGAIAVNYIRRGRRAAAVADLAAIGKGYSFTLEGRWLTVADGLGTARPELSFNVAHRHRRELLEAPHAIALRR